MWKNSIFVDVNAKYVLLDTKMREWRQNGRDAVSSTDYGDSFAGLEGRLAYKEALGSFNGAHGGPQPLPPYTFLFVYPVFQQRMLRNVVK